MKIETAITKIKSGEEYIRGKSLAKLIEKVSFTEAIFLLFTGRLPGGAETKMLNALLVAAIDHGAGTASALTARVVASAKNSLHTSVAAGILAMGERHGSAIEGAAKFFQDNLENDDLLNHLKKLKENKIRVAGFGHAVLTQDNRAKVLLKMAKKNNFFGNCCQLALRTEKILNSLSDKKIPLNIDGAMAAILSDMGFSWQVMKAFFIIGRVPGLSAQVYEELTNDTGLKRLNEEEIIYK